jgi:hypothetical protein
MDSLHVDYDLMMKEKAEFSEVLLTGSYVGGDLYMSSSKVVGKLNMDSIHIDHNLVLQNKAEFGQIVLRGARVTGLVSLVGSKIAGKLDMDALQADKSLSMGGGAEFREIVLVGAHIGGQIDLSRSRVAGPLEMDSLRVDHNLMMNRGAEFSDVDLRDAHIGGQISLKDSKVNGEVVLSGAQIGGQVYLTNSRVSRKANMESLHVGQSQLMRDATFGEVVLSGARVDGQLDMSGSKVTGTLNMEALQVGSELFLGRDAEFRGPIILIFGKIGGNLELAGGSFLGDVNLTGAQIGGELRLGSSQHEPARWQRNATLILRNAKADAIQDLSNSWPDRLDLNGFTYRSLGGLNATEMDPMIGRPVEWFIAWLEKQNTYAPTPYQQLATVLRNEGRPNAADEVLYAGKERERASAPFLFCIWLTGIKWLIGYGYHLEWTLLWIAGFLIAGILALQLSGEGRANGMPYGIAYSFDMLLPIIRLRENHYQIDLHGWVRYYFYVHRTMGYVLASFLIAGISGLTK